MLLISCLIAINQLGCTNAIMKVENNFEPGVHEPVWFPQGYARPAPHTSCQGRQESVSPPSWTACELASRLICACSYDPNSEDSLSRFESTDKLGGRVDKLGKPQQSAAISTRAPAKQSSVPVTSSRAASQCGVCRVCWRGKKERLARLPAIQGKSS